jgi:kynurenine formamidase
MSIKRRKFLQGATSILTSIGIGGGCASSPKIQDSGKVLKKTSIVLKGLKRTLPSEQEYFAYSKRFSNWGRWGKEDKLGTLNFIDEEVVRNANQLIKQGRHLSLGRPISNSHLSMYFYQRIKWGDGGFTAAFDRISVEYHGYVETHIDALSHAFTIDDTMYNGHPASDVTEKGAKSHGIENWADGIVTRGVLYDIPRLRNEDHITFDRPVQGWELEDFAKKEDIQPRRGDAVIINCGRNDYFKSNPTAPNVLGKKPGLHPSVLEFLYQYDAALLGSDFDEASNHGYSTPYPIHAITNPYMGMPTLWNLDLDRLTQACIQSKSWEFVIIIAPLIVVGGTGSAVNPIAIL